MKMLLNDSMIERTNIVDIEDRGYQFGDGIYEVIGVYEGRTFLLDEHLQRLQRSASELRISLPYTLENLKAKLNELVKVNELNEGVIYLQVTRGTAERWHQFPENTRPNLVAYTKEEEVMTELEESGAKAVLTEDIRWLRCDIKTLNLLPNVLAKQKAIENGAVEAIMHRGNIVTEGSASNVFIVKDGTVYTHPANNYILNGITRQKVLEICRKNKIAVHEETFTVDDLFQADEVFITATKLDIIPIIQVNERIIGNGKRGKVAETLLQDFRASIHHLVEN
ncbi:D-alanine aminotransferase [Compostibacillus humi]|uniref:D-alanine aminotransferase n=1 Tax=Compostibacillus humi TaxID=1245525 RepID=A0A8J2TL34_9BACI|nr:D-amino-acid transaminase [Compostibacillus humi]GFZ75598.1 D-alanine aminotransferase [Compostibacillus humi]